MNEKEMPLLLGAHTSAAGGVWEALYRGKAIGATTVQLFTSNQRQWRGKVMDKDIVARFQKAQEESGLKDIMCHASYLLNLGSPNKESLAKSRMAFREEVVRCLALGIRYLNFHPGAALDGGVPACLDRIVESLLGVADLLAGQKGLHLLIETTAGQGSTVGWRFEELAHILKGMAATVPVGVCMDTCHVFAAGYDIRTPAGWEKVLAEFDRIVGLDALMAFHLNDSLHDLGSRKDRHAPLGKGKIGMEAFTFLMESAVTRGLPKYLETPGGPDLWKEEIAHLRTFV